MNSCPILNIGQGVVANNSTGAQYSNTGTHSRLCRHRNMSNVPCNELVTRIGLGIGLMGTTLVGVYGSHLNEHHQKLSSVIVSSGFILGNAIISYVENTSPSFEHLVRRIMQTFASLLLVLAGTLGSNGLIGSGDSDFKSFAALALLIGTWTIGGLFIHVHQCEYSNIEASNEERMALRGVGISPSIRVISSSLEEENWPVADERSPSPIPDVDCD